MDLPQTQVKPREIGFFVDNLERLLIKWKYFGKISEPSGSKGLANMGGFIKIYAIQCIYNGHSSFSRKLNFQQLKITFCYGNF